MKPLDLPYIKTVRSRGHVYYYFDTGKVIGGKRQYRRLPDKSDKAFGGSYAAFLGHRERSNDVPQLPTVREASRAYQLSQGFRKKAEATQSTYLTYLKVLEDYMGDAPVSEVSRGDVFHLIEKRQRTPGAANMLLLVTRMVFKMAVSKQWIDKSPALEVEQVEGDEEKEHEPWPEDLIEKALADPAVMLPVALLYFTAQRIGDVCKMRWSDVRDGFIEVKQQKTKTELDIRLHDRLRRILASTPKDAMTILYGKKLRPMRIPTLRLRLQKWARDNGHEVVPHGLRKNAVNALLEAGCSVGETSAISGQSLKMVEHYAKRRNTRKMGSAAILRWEGNGS